MSLSALHIWILIHIFAHLAESCRKKMLKVCQIGWRQLLNRNFHRFFIRLRSELWLDTSNKINILCFETLLTRSTLAGRSRFSLGLPTTLTSFSVCWWNTSLKCDATITMGMVFPKVMSSVRFLPNIPLYAEKGLKGHFWSQSRELVYLSNKFSCGFLQFFFFLPLFHKSQLCGVSTVQALFVLLIAYPIWDVDQYRTFRSNLALLIASLTNPILTESLTFGG